jgi:hypothetical protein
MAECFLVGSDGKPTGIALQPVFRGQRDYYFKVDPDTLRTEHVFEFLKCKDGHVLWAVPHDKVSPCEKR